MLSKEQLQKYIKNHSSRKYEIDQLYYQGDNYAILSAEKKRKPDNRVPIAFVNRLVKNLSGYAARPGDVYIENDADETQFSERMMGVYEDSNEYILNSKLYKGTLKYGLSYDIVWTESTPQGLKIQVADIPIGQVIPIWDDGLATVKKLKEVIRVFMKDDRQYATYFYAGGYTTYEVEAKAYGLPEIKGMVEEVVQPFSKVQVSAYQGNDERISYWQPVKSLIDEFDKVMSKNANEVDRFNDTWLAFMQKIDAKTKSKIDEIGVIDNLQLALKEGVTDVFPRFIDRNVPTDHARMMLDKLEALIYTINGVPNFLDETLGAASGISMLYRLIGLEYSAVETDTYFDMGLKNRDSLIKEAIMNTENIQGSDEWSPRVVHKRNLPVNVIEIVDTAIKLKGIGVSDETILKYLPDEIVPDVAQELERLSETRESIGTVEDLTADVIAG